MQTESRDLQRSQKFCHSSKRLRFDPRMRAAWLARILLLFLLSSGIVVLRGASIDELTRQLTAPTVEVRRTAAFELNKLGPSAKAALPALIEALDDPDKQVWSLAVGTIATIGPEAKAAIPALIEAMDTREMKGRRERDRVQTIMRSAYALSRIGDAAIAELISALESKDSGARAGAVRALGGMGPAAKRAIPGLTANMGHAEGFVRREVVEAFGKIGPVAVPALLRVIVGSGPVDRTTAALALGQIGTPANSAEAALLKALEKESDPYARAAILSVLPRIGADARTIVPVLTSALRSDDVIVRGGAMTALLLVKPADEAVVPALREVLVKGLAKDAQTAAVVLGRLGEVASPAAHEIVAEALKLQPPPPPFIEALVQFGSQAAPALVAAFDGRVRDVLTKDHWLVQCLRSIGAPALPALDEALSNPNPARRFGAMRTLGEMGLVAKPLAESMLPLAADPDPRVRAMTLGALASAHAESRLLLPRIEIAMSDPVPFVRLTAIQLIPYLGPDGAPLAPFLRAALEDGDSAVRQAAGEVLKGKR